MFKTGTESCVYSNTYRTQRLSKLCLQQEMAKEALHLGDKATADVRLHLIGSTGEEYGGNPIFCHSQVLKKSELFQTKLSERRSSDKPPFEIKVKVSESNEKYMKCIQLMYSYYEDECFYFSDVDEALSILPVASELMFHDCIKECMLYLDAVRWNPQQKVQLQALLSSLQINTLPALMARLGMSQDPKSGCGHTEILKESLQELLSVTRNGSDQYCSIVEKHLLHYFDANANASPAVKDECRNVILKEFTVHIEILKSKSDDQNSVQLTCSTLSWLIHSIQQHDRKLFEALLKKFCEDTDLRKSITQAVNSYSYAYTHDILCILISMFLKAMGNGDIITPASFRVFFLTNWVDIMVALVAVWEGNTYRRSTIKEFVTEMEKGIADVGDTLSLVEQKLIYNIWKNAFTKHSLSISNAVKWWSDTVQDHKDYLM